MADLDLEEFLAHPTKSYTSDTTRARTLAHQAFDELWSGPRSHMTRKEAYRWLTKAMRISPERAHIRLMTKNECRLLRWLVATHWTATTRTPDSR